ncbi:hypothetical protein GCM10012286_64640 [Streptomyces lasiicapitis]|uniref:Uncharacterized protein n=1 Tax=Streptomyces lasiicapitis TaxID=1923961 RepID=A0ABQ2MNK7_9ACTN|nr:hypothetical protein GCM10012286_64640 [Streptomyces lasiicapitis]
MCPGEALVGEGQGPGVAAVTGDGEALVVRGEGRGSVVALFGEEAEFGEKERGAGAEVDFAVPCEASAEVLVS